jgi:hypothetical protein
MPIDAWVAIGGSRLAMRGFEYGNLPVFLRLVRGEIFIAPRRKYFFLAP